MYLDIYVNQMLLAYITNERILFDFKRDPNVSKKKHHNKCHCIVSLVEVKLSSVVHFIQ